MLIRGQSYKEQANKLAGCVLSVSGPDDELTEKLQAHRVPQDVQHAVRAADSDGCCPALRRAWYHADRYGSSHRACECNNQPTSPPASNTVFSTTGLCRSMHFLEEVRGTSACLCTRILTLKTAEDVLADLGVRQAMRNMPKNARL